MLNLKPASGFSLIDMMIALFVSSIVLGGMITLFSVSISASNHTVSAMKIDSELRHVASMMNADLRRLGYWNDAAFIIGTGDNSNPFMTSTTDLFISTDGSCITYSYDLNKDGVLSDIDDPNGNERFGFRLSNETLKTRPLTGDFDCTSAADQWDALTVPTQIKITNLLFTLSPELLNLSDGSSNVTMRTVNTSISGKWAGDSTLVQTHNSTVKIRNDNVNTSE